MVRNVKGFTMVELMIVIAIIGILAVTLIPTITGAQAKARDTGRISSLTNAGTSMTSYSTDVGSYPIASNGCLTDVNGTIAGYIDKPSGSDVSTKLAKFFTNSKAALDPQKATITLADVCVIAWSYGYQAGKLTTNQDSGIFVAELESDTRGNVLTAPTTSTTNDGSLSAAITLANGAGEWYVRVVTGN